MLRHTCDKTKRPGLERRSGLEVVNPGGPRVPVWKLPPGWTPRLGIPSFSTPSGHLRAPPVGTGEPEGKLGPVSTEERTGLWDAAEVAAAGPGQQRQEPAASEGQLWKGATHGGGGQRAAARPRRLVFSGAQWGQRRTKVGSL